MDFLLELCKHFYTLDIGSFTSSFKAIPEAFIQHCSQKKKSHNSVIRIPSTALIDLPANFEGYGPGQQAKTCITTQTQQLPCQQS